MAQFPSSLGQTGKLINDGKPTLAGFVGAMAEDADARKPGDAVTSFEPDTPVMLSTGVTPTKAQLAALENLPGLLESVTWPDSRRQLSTAEKESLLALLDAVKDAKDLVEAAEGSLKPALFNELDVTAEKTGELAPGTETDKYGWYAFKGQVTAQGVEIAAERRVRRGSVSLSPEDILEATTLPGAELTHKDYLAVTRQVREVDENALFALIAKRPTLAAVFNQLVKRGAPSLSLYRVDKKG